MSTIATETNARVVSPFLIALCAIGFLMPFVSFSCGNTSIVKSSGTQLITGADVNPSFGDLGNIAGGSSGVTVTPNSQSGSIGPFASSSQAGKVHVNPDPVAAVAGLFVVLALVFCALRGRVRAMLVTAAAAAAAVALLALQIKLTSAFNSDVDRQSALQRSSTTSSDAFNLSVNADIKGLVGLDWQAGYWLVVGGLLVVAGLNLYVLYVLLARAGPDAGPQAQPAPGTPPPPV